MAFVLPGPRSRRRSAPWCRTPGCAAPAAGTDRRPSALRLPFKGGDDLALEITGVLFQLMGVRAEKSCTEQNPFCFSGNLGSCLCCGCRKNKIGWQQASVSTYQFSAPPGSAAFYLFSQPGCPSYLKAHHILFGEQYQLWQMWDCFGTT